MALGRGIGSLMRLLAVYCSVIYLGVYDIPDWEALESAALLNVLFLCAIKNILL